MGTIVEREKVEAGGRRRGQALILAVLLMVFISLLGATFVTLVALNLKRVARDEDKAAAKSSAQAGVLWVDAQIAAEGEDWRPEQLAAPPAPGEASYNEYYSSLDKAQGWARTVPAVSSADNDARFNVRNGDWNKDGKAPSAAGSYTPADRQADEWAKLDAFKQGPSQARVFVKMPDPRQPRNSGTAPYLAEVKYIPRQSDASRGYQIDLAESVDKRGSLRLTVIGLSNNDPNAWERRVLYKATSQRGAATSFARYDANADAQGKPIVSDVTGASTLAGDTLTVPVADVDGMDPGLTLLAGNGAFATISNVNPANKTVSLYTLSNSNLTSAQLQNAFARGNRVATVSTLMTGLPSAQMDGDGNGASKASEGDGTLLPLPTPPAAPSPGSALYLNNGAILAGRYAFRPVASNNPDVPSDALTVSGKIVRASTQVQAELVPPSGAPVPLPDSSTIDAPSNASGAVREGTGEASGDPTKAKRLSEFVSPPRLDAPNSQYVRQTKFADLNNGSSFGFGPGLYIDNGDDIERVTVGSSRRTLANWEMSRLWQRKSFPVSSGGNILYTGRNGAIATGATGKRLAFPRPGFDTYAYPLTAGTLEERAVRGWVSPWEFRPRGAQIELRGDQVIVTRDDRSDYQDDGILTRLRPDPRKAWKSPTGGALPGSLSDRTYRMVLDLKTGVRKFGVPGNEQTVGAAVPFNGVILADGNVRVRGFLGERDLTIVSMGNIYIEGSIRRGKVGNRVTRVALLAKRSVVLNPTAFLARVAGAQDRDVAQAVVGGAGVQATVPGSPSRSATVSDASFFRVGDRVRVGTTFTGWRRVTGVNPGARVLEFDDVVTSGPVRLLSGGALVNGASLSDDTENVRRTGEYFHALAKSDEVWARDFKFDNLTRWSNGDLLGNSPLWVSMQRAGEMKEAFRLRAPVVSTPPVSLPAAPASVPFAPASVPAAPTFIATLDNGITALDDDGGGDDGGDDDGGGNPVPVPVPVPTAVPTVAPTVGNRQVWVKNDPTRSQPETLSGKRNLFVRNQDGTRPFECNWGGAPGEEAEQRTLDQERAKFLREVQPQTPGWDFVPAGGVGGVLARKVARVSTSLWETGGRADNSWDASVTPDGPGFGVLRAPLTTSVSQFFRPGGDLPVGQLFDDGSSRTPDELLRDSRNRVLAIGSAAQLSTLTVRDEDAQTVSEAFYWSVPNGAQLLRKQASLKWNTIELFAPGSAGSTNRAPSNDSNGFLLQRDIQDAAPALRVGQVKLERDDWNGATARDFKPLEISVEAFIYAQTGSWFAIAPPLHAAESLDTAEKRARATRQRRLNYAVTVVGTVMQNHSATGELDFDGEVDPDGRAWGAMKTWIDALSYPTRLTKIGQASDPLTGSDWQSIVYAPDSVPGDSTLQLPAAPGGLAEG